MQHGRAEVENFDQWYRPFLTLIKAGKQSVALFFVFLHRASAPEWRTPMISLEDCIAFADRMKTKLQQSASKGR